MRTSKQQPGPHRPTLDELQILIDALTGRTTPIDEIRGQIINALEWLHLDIFGDEVCDSISDGGRPEAWQTTRQASLVAVLKDEHGIPIKAGLWAVESGHNPRADKRRQAIARKCSDIRNGKADGLPIDDSAIQAALEQIRNRK